MKNQETTKTYRAQRPKALVRRSYQGIGEISNEKYKRMGKDKKKRKRKSRIDQLTVYKDSRRPAEVFLKQEAVPKKKPNNELLRHMKWSKKRNND